MNTRSTSFRTKVIAGYALVIATLIAGMFYTIGRLREVAAEELARIQFEERQITEVERLRWLGEAIVADGRGYLITGDPEIRARADASAREFERRSRALATTERGSTEYALVAEVHATGEAFRHVQAEFMNARAESQDVAGLFERFDGRVVPSRLAFSESLERLVRQKEALIDAVYRETERERDVLTAWAYGLCGILALSSLAVAAVFGRKLVHAHEELQQAVETTHKAIAGRDELMGIVAHDLRNPLGSISLKAALLRQRSDPDTVRRQAESIESIAMRMASLIRTMLDVTTLEAGRFTVHPVPTEVDDLVRTAFDVFESIAQEKQIRLEQAVATASIAVRADKERVLQVLSNLLGNAIKFTPSGGAVRLEVRREGEVARFAVSDTGIGIEGADLAHLFDRFWQRETGGKKGTGLGLFIAKGIVEAHGGEIRAESQPGCGTTLSFTLPLAAREHRARAAS